VISAIVIVGPETRGQEEGGAQTGAISAGLCLAETQAWRGTPLVCVDVLGRSVMRRLIDEMRLAGVDVISLVGDVSEIFALCIGPAVSVIPCCTEAVGRTAKQQLSISQQSGIDATLIVRAGAYFDVDLRDAKQAHDGQGRAATRFFDMRGPLDVWIVDPARFDEGPDLLIALQEDEPAQYLVSRYVNRLERPQDLRQLVMDGLTSRCGLRPQGTEIRSGVWIGQGAYIHKDARIVAPAFIGRRTTIAEQCLITRCSNIERDCRVDFGTVVEDSSILSNSYLGIGLDLSHAIVEGKNLFNLKHAVTLEIVDPCIIRQNAAPHQETNFRSSVGFGFDGQSGQSEES
jgi:carbonic anhydrase/acetyltransferase-like protein (isoleucine patch superfamily)